MLGSSSYPGFRASSAARAAALVRTHAAAPSVCRELYRLLHEAAPAAGLWRLVGEGPRGSLIRFTWTQDGLEGCEVEPREPLTGHADAVPWASVCPSRGLTVGVRVDRGGRNATVTFHGLGGPGMRRSPSAEAAAAVALPASQASPGRGALGTSPQGSFEAEWLQFMNTSVAARGSRAKQRRRWQRGGGPGAQRADRIARPVAGVTGVRAPLQRCVVLPPGH